MAAHFSSGSEGANQSTGGTNGTIPNENPSIEKMIVDRRRERTERSAGFCPKCGKPIQQSDQYCPGCGEKIVR
jgi:tRNA(Ile2) C34 agmatinyltransferase TiaS